MEPPSQAEQDEQQTETPGRRLIPPRESRGPISPVSPVEASNVFPQGPERSARRSQEVIPDQSRPASIATQPREPYDAYQPGSHEYPYPSRKSTLRETPGAGPPGAGPPPGDDGARMGLGPAKTLDNLKRAAAGVHVSLTRLLPRL